MAKRARFYVGRKNQIMEVIPSREKPTKQTHPHFDSFIGAFKTRRGAEHMAEHGIERNLKTISQAEKEAAAEFLVASEA